MRSVFCLRTLEHQAYFDLRKVNEAGNSEHHDYKMRNLKEPYSSKVVMCLNHHTIEAYKGYMLYWRNGLEWFKGGI
jgi:hypothetical protein